MGAPECLMREVLLSLPPPESLFQFASASASPLPLFHSVLIHLPGLDLRPHLLADPCRVVSSMPACASPHRTVPQLNPRIFLIHRSDLHPPC